MTKEEKLARKQQRKAEKVGLGKLLLWNSSSCSVALSTLIGEGKVDYIRERVALSD